MKNYTLLSYLSLNSLRKIIIHRNKQFDYKNYLGQHCLDDNKETLVGYISNNVELTHYHKLIKEINEDDSVIDNDWLDNVGNWSCLII